MSPSDEQTSPRPMTNREELAERLEEWIPSCGAEVPIAMEEVLREAAALARASAPSEARVDAEDVRRCRHWAGRVFRRKPDDSDAEALTRILDALEPAQSDPTPDRVAEGARVNGCVTMGCAGKAVAEFRWYENGYQVGHYCESCLATMERHYGSYGSETTRYEPASTGVREDKARAELAERLEQYADNLDWNPRRQELVREAASTLQAYEKALREIAESDSVDNALDPDRNPRIACATLKGEDDVDAG